MDLTLVLAGIIAFGVLTYIILDGFDLGIGILFPYLPDRFARDTAVASIAPVWDGNETWLILGGAVLFGAFPGAYAAALPAFYIPLMVMLFALLFRGLAFEFRLKAKATRRYWSAAFIAGSTLAAFCQGLLLGGLVQGVRLKDGQFAGGPFDWLSAFSVASGLGVVAGYALLGATWLVFKTEGGLRDWARAAALRALLLVLLFFVVTSVQVILHVPHVAERWYQGEGDWLALVFTLGFVLIALGVWRELRRGSNLRPFLLAICFFSLSFVSILISLWPYLVPPSMTLAQAAAPRSSQWFMLLAVCLTLPMVMLYTGYAYYVFRGKLSENTGYTRH